MTIEHLHTWPQFFSSNFYQARVHQDTRAYAYKILKRNVNLVTEKKFSWPQMKRLASGKASGHSFHVSLKALIIICSSQPKWDCLGSLDADCWRSWPRPGLKAWLCFHLTRHYHNHIFTSDFLHPNISPWHATEADLTRQVKRKFCFQRRDPILFIFSPPQSFYSFDRFSKDLVKS